jgi:acyl-CoA oxidase
VSAK